MKRRILFLVAVLCFLLCDTVVYAENTEESESYQEYLELMFGNYDMASVNEAVAGYYPEMPYNGTELMQLLMQGKVKEVFSCIWTQTCNRIWGELPFAKHVFLYVLVLGIASSFFSGFADLFAGGKHARIAFYLLYLMLMGILMKVFVMTSQIASQVLGSVVDFVKMFIPAYFVAIGISNGTQTAVVYYEVMLLVIYFVENFIKAVVLPMAYSYMMLAFLNGLWTEDRLVLLLDLLKKEVLLSLKVVLGMITGLSLVQAVIVPVVDGLKNSAIHKAVSAIPGIGGAAKGITELLMGAAVLIKNSMGVLLLLLLVGICLIPVLKILFLALSVKLASAITGIISDKRISDCANHVGEGCFLILRCVFTCVALFFIVVAVIAYSIMV